MTQRVKALFVMYNSPAQRGKRKGNIHPVWGDIALFLCVFGYKSSIAERSVVGVGASWWGASALGARVS